MSAGRYASLQPCSIQWARSSVVEHHIGIVGAAGAITKTRILSLFKPCLTQFPPSPYKEKIRKSKMIGIISDTHDNIPNILKAVEIFKKNKVEFVIHCGDVVAPATIPYFSGLNMKFVFGNCDGDRTRIEEKCKEQGFEHHGRIIELKLKGKTIGVFHGDDILINDKMLRKGFDYYIHGHTHIPEDKTVGNTRILCPGGHYLGDPPSYKKIILLNLDNGKALFMDL